MERAHRPGATWRRGLRASSAQLHGSTKACASGEFEKEKKKIIQKERFMASRKPPDRVQGGGSRSPPRDLGRNKQSPGKPASVSCCQASVAASTPRLDTARQGRSSGGRPKTASLPEMCGAWSPRADIHAGLGGKGQSSKRPQTAEPTHFPFTMKSAVGGVKC